MLNRVVAHTSEDVVRLNDEPEADVAGALAELSNLLDQYAPAWYTQEHHDRAKAALRAATRTRSVRSNC